MSLKFLSSNFVASHGPGVDGQLPHDIPTFLDSRSGEAIILDLFAELRQPFYLTTILKHAITLAPLDM